MKVNLVLTAILLLGQAAPPPQPASEAEVAAAFVDAAPSLFGHWFERRDALRADERLGYKAEPLVCLGNTSYLNYFEFKDCRETRPPRMVGVDVQKSASILTPFTGLIMVSFDEECAIRRAVPAKVSWSMKNYDRLAPHCIGHTYDECIAAGARPAPPLMASACTGGPVTRFTFQDELPLEYGWSQGRWVFEAHRSVIRPARQAAEE